MQNQFDILDGERSGYKGVLDYAVSAGLSFIAWSPMARGLLTEKYRALNTLGPGDRLFDEAELKEKTMPPKIGKLHRLSALARDWGLELNQLVIAYMLSLPGMGPLIPSSSDVRHLDSNAAAGKIILTEEQKSSIREIEANDS